MTEKHITNKVKVFISSKCDNPDDYINGSFQYGVMRKSLKLLLEETNICEVFAFESGNATSFSVMSSYMDALSDSNLVIVIVDNKDGITNATMKEINRARAQNLKCIYVFCDERQKEPTELQKELILSTANPRYYIVHEFSDIPEAVYKSVLNDIISIYISYCRGRIDYINTEKLETLDNGNVEISIAGDSNIAKSIFKNFPYTKLLLTKEAGLSFGELEEKESEQDYNCACLLGQVIGSSFVEAPNFSKIKQDIKQLHKGNIQKLITLRYEAVEDYFTGNLNGCIKKLNTAIEFINSRKNIPKWLFNDVALDLRNIQIELDHEKDIINLQSAGQEYLDKDDEPLYYPVIDRIVSNNSEEILKKELMRTTQPPNTVNIGGASYILDNICNTFIVAYYYGSLTHMVMIRKRVFEYVGRLALEARMHRIFMFSVRLLLMSNEEKLLKQFLETYGENTNNTNETDIDNLLSALDKQPIKLMRLLSKELAIRFFGYYYSNDTFNRETNILLSIIKDCINKNYATSHLIKPIINAMNDNSYRFKEQVVLDFIYYLFDHGCKRYYDDAFLFLYGFHFKQLSIEEQKQYQKFMIDSINNDEIRNSCHYILYASQTLRQNETISHDALDEAVQTKNPKFYRDTYRLNVENHDEAEGWEFIEKFVKEIEYNNQTQGKGRIYTDSAYDPYITIGNILLKTRLKFDSKQLKNIMEAIKGTISSKTQTIEAKYRATELLVYMQLNQSANRQIKRFYHEMRLKKHEVIEAKEVFFDKGYSKGGIEFNICLLGIVLKEANETEFGIRLVDIQNSDISVQLRVLSTIEKMLQFNLSSFSSYVKNILFQFILHESMSPNGSVRFRAMSVMTKIKSKSYKEVCLERFVEMMDSEPYKVKVGLLYRFEKEEVMHNPKVRYIFDKGKVDSHYWVRTAANRFGI